MKIKSTALVALLALSAPFTFAASGCSMSCVPGVKKHDKLILKYNEAQEAWSNIEATLQRRYDLIPNLVSSVKAQTAHEQKTFTEVAAARSAATAASQIQLSPADLEDPAKMAAFMEAQAKVGNTARAAFAMVQEQYPELASSEGFSDLRAQLEGTENRILRAREVYNKKVKEYNTELQIVGGEVLNAVTGQKFAAMQYYKGTAAAVSGPAPKVEF